MSESTVLDAMDSTAPDIEIEVETHYLQQESQPESNRHVFSYTITITNHSQVGIKLLTRYWHIEDANNKVQEVTGEGVIGQQPHLGHKQSFQYTSGAILETAAGIMEGHYDFVSDNGDVFKAPVPAFTLANPAILH